MADSEEAGSAGPRGKVNRLIKEYDLEELGSVLERRWTNKEGQEQHSLRDLATFFNHELLRSAIADTEMEIVEGDIENIYRLLTDDEVSAGTRIQTRNRLERNGIDVEQLKQDFVTRQAIHTYLRKHRGVEYTGDEKNKQDRVQSRGQNIQRLKNRLVAVTEDTLQTLSKSGEIVLGDFDVLVTVTVQCSDCGDQYEIRKLFANGGCNCQS